MNIRILIGLFVAIFLLQASPAEAHRPYFIPYSNWIKSGEQEYQLQRWYGDGIFAADPVSMALLHRNGGMSAWTTSGSHASGFCPSIDFCWGFTFDPFGLFPTIWRLNTQAVAQPTKAIEKDPRDYFGYPEHDAKNSRGFDVSLNYLMLPIAWGALLPLLPPVPSLIGFLSSTLFITFWIALKEAAKIKSAIAKASAVGFLGLGVLLFFVLMIFFAGFYALGIPVILPFIVLTIVKQLKKVHIKEASP
jgi:hypothetical protein